MADRPILFSAPMVRALLAGTKTQTRRALKPQPPEGARYSGIHYASDEPASHFFNSSYGPHKVRAPIEEGDVLWVREAYSGPYYFTDIAPRHWKPSVPIWYWADGNPQDGDWTKPKPGIHMPRWASRLTLTVTDVRVERLQNISEEDAIAEGVGDAPPGRPAIVQYLGLWDQINGSGAWARNDWVVAYTFDIALRIDVAAG